MCLSIAYNFFRQETSRITISHYIENEIGAVLYNEVLINIAVRFIKSFGNYECKGILFKRQPDLKLLRSSPD
jgi:hypothetical protein